MNPVFVCFSRLRLDILHDVEMWQRSYKRIVSTGSLTFDCGPVVIGLYAELFC